MESIVLNETTANATIQLLTAVDKIGVVAALLLFIAYLIYKQKIDAKILQEFIEGEKERGERIERTLEASSRHNELLREILMSFKSDIMTDIREIRHDIKQMNNKFA